MYGVTNSFRHFRGDGADVPQVLEKKPKRHKRVIRITSKQIRFRAEIFECELVLASFSPGALYAKRLTVHTRLRVDQVMEQR